MPLLSESVLKADNITCAYGDTEIVTHANFTLQAKTITMLMGANGAGKSTLLRCLAGWTHPKDGTVFICGEMWQPSKKELRAKVAFVPDTPAFYDDLTAEEHLRFVLGANLQSERMSYAQKLLEDFGLYPHRGQLPSSYSRGMREKLALVIAFSYTPSVLLLDEPYTSLDKRSAERLSQEIHRMADTGGAILVSCHQKAPGLHPHAYAIIEDGHLHIEKDYPEEAWWMQALSDMPAVRDDTGAHQKE